jgi:hypothetical protein
VIYYISRDERGWLIRHQGNYTGPYGDRDEAVRLAVAAAREKAERGYDASVRLREPGEPWRTIFESDRPPAAKRSARKRRH